MLFFYKILILIYFWIYSVVHSLDITEFFCEKIEITDQINLTSHKAYIFFRICLRTIFFLIFLDFEIFKKDILSIWTY